MRDIRFVYVLVFHWIDFFLFLVLSVDSIVYCADQMCHGCFFGLPSGIYRFPSTNVLLQLVGLGVTYRFRQRSSGRNSCEPGNNVTSHQCGTI